MSGAPSEAQHAIISSSPIRSRNSKRSLTWQLDEWVQCRGEKKMTVAGTLAYSQDDEELSDSLSGLQAPQGEDAADSAGMRVLLVEDDFADTQLLQRALCRHPQVSDVVARNSPTLALVELSSGKI